MENRLKELLAKQDIIEMIYLYCRGYDRMDADLALSVWHPEGTVAYGDRYDGSAKDYIGPSWKYRSKLSGFSHQVSNILIELDGETAVSESYVTASLQFPPESGITNEDIYRGRYLDRWSYRFGRWAIDHRKFLPDSYSRVSFASELIDKSFLAGSKTNKSDPSYQLFSQAYV